MHISTSSTIIATHETASHLKPQIAKLTCIYPRTTPLSLLCSNHTKPYSHCRPRSSHRLYSSAFSPVLISLRLVYFGRELEAIARSAMERLSRLCSTDGPPGRSGKGEGASDWVRVRGSGGMCRILKENTMDPSAKREVSGKDEKALPILSFN
jgi:hypothetical protein